MASNDNILNDNNDNVNNDNNTKVGEKRRMSPTNNNNDNFEPDFKRPKKIFNTPSQLLRNMTNIDPKIPSI